MEHLIDPLETYYIDVLGYSQEDCSEMTSDELLDNLTPEQLVQFKAYTA